MASDVTRAAWSGRFGKSTAPLAQRFGASIPFDWQLWRYDIAGSIAHARMLARQQIISTAALGAIERGLAAVRQQIDAGTFVWQLEREDVHMNVEAALGEAGRALHTARSRNDQVALDLRLYAREAIVRLGELLARLQQVLVSQATQHVDDLLPGYTHLQRAQPISLAHHLLAYHEMLQRDLERLADGFARVNVLPLGSGALAGVPYPIDRHYVAGLLGFERISANSLDAVADRDFAVELLANLALCGVHLSRLGEELVLWSSAEFRYLELDDAYATGSSIMPQKKNPDFAELLRGKSGRLLGDLISLLTVLKGLPLAYNKDLQEDKEPLFDAVDTVAGSLELAAEMLATSTFNTARMAEAAGQDYTTATDLADYLVRHGLPFRDAHHAIGELVQRAIAAGRQLGDLSLTDLQSASPLFEGDALQVIRAEASASARDVPGGTAPAQVRAALAAAQKQATVNATTLARLQTPCETVERLLDSVQQSA